MAVKILSIIYPNTHLTAAIIEALEFIGRAFVNVGLNYFPVNRHTREKERLCVSKNTFGMMRRYYLLVLKK